MFFANWQLYEEVQILKRYFTLVHSSVHTLSSQLAGFADSLLLQVHRFDSEQLYRRGRESSFGTSGYRESGEELSRSFGVLLFKQSADLGHADAQYTYGASLWFGQSCLKDEELGVQYLRMSADANNSFAEILYGVALLEGRGIAMNPPLGREYVERAVNVGNAFAQGMMAQWKESGSGVAKDARGAFALYRMSAEQGNAVGQMGYGLALIFRLAGVHDPVAGANLVKRAADRGYTKAMFFYGKCLEEGHGVPPNRRLAAKFYFLAAVANDPTAQEAYERCRR
jgi:TPR repeat protein